MINKFVHRWEIHKYLCFKNFSIILLIIRSNRVFMRAIVRVLLDTVLVYDNVKDTKNI